MDDDVDKIVAQWRAERPDLDVAPMALIGRLMRLSLHLSQEMGKTFAQHGLNAASFDVLATLRRSGAPYQLSPNDLLATMMITSGTLTHRIDQLVKTGFVDRIANHNDGRSVLIALTPIGLAKINAVICDHVATQQRLTAELSDDEFQRFNQLVKTHLAHFEQ